MGLLIVYCLYPIAIAGVLRAMGWSDRRGLIVCLALGLGPLLAGLILETLIFLRPGPIDSTLVMVALLTPAALLIWLGRRGLRLILPLTIHAAIVIIGAFILLAFAWLISSSTMLWSWDPTCYRLLADRIVAEGDLIPQHLLFTPTFGGLNFVHALHGMRYPMLLVMNRLFASGSSAFDVLPHIWFFCIAIGLTAAVAGSKRGFASPLAWIAAALLLSCDQFFLWAHHGTNVAISMFGSIAVLTTCWIAAEDDQPTRTIIVRWIVAGLTLGFVMGGHRMSFILPIIYICIAGAAIYVDHTKQKQIIAVLSGVVCAMISFGIYGWLTVLTIGGLREANPVSAALVPLRESWRQTFQPPLLELAYQQFWQISHGALIWSSAAFVGLMCIVVLVFIPRTRVRCVWIGVAGGMAIAGIAAVVSDLTMLFQHSGMELLLRSSRYRQMAAPVLVFAAIAGGRWIVRSIRNPVPDDLSQTPIHGSWLMSLAAIILLAILFIFTALRVDRYSIPQSIPEAIAQFKAGILQDDRTKLITRYPELDSCITILNETTEQDTRTIIDFMPMIPFLDIELSNPWLNPGVMDVLNASSPEQAMNACLDQSISQLVLGTWQTGAELFSSTGLRHAMSIHTTELVFDDGKFQVFRFRDAFVPEVSTRPIPVQYTLFDKPLTKSGEYELLIDMESKHELTIIQTVNDIFKRTFIIRNWQPAVAGPQRIRFRVIPGESVQLELIMATDDIESHIQSLTLLHTPLTDAGDNGRNKSDG